jgi:hypothetical protein
MSRTEVAAQSVVEPRRDDEYPRLAAGIHVLVAGREEEVDAPAAGQLRIALEGAGVAREILGGSELERVHVERQDDIVRLGAGGIDEHEMTFVQVAHRRHEADALSAGARFRNFGANRSDRRDTPHSNEWSLSG